MANYKIKDYRLNENFGIRCITYPSSYSVEIVILGLPWLEVVESVERIPNKDEANRVFLQLKNKYINKTGKGII